MSKQIGTFVRGAAPVVAEVPVELTTSEYPTPHAWSGQFVVPAGADPALGSAELRLADGRIGDVVLYRLDAGAGRTIVVNFYGIGSLRKAG